MAIYFDDIENFKSELSLKVKKKLRDEYQFQNKFRQPSFDDISLRLLDFVDRQLFLSIGQICFLKDEHQEFSKIYKKKNSEDVSVFVFSFVLFLQ